MRDLSDADPERVTIEAEGATLAGRFYPALGPARATLLIHGATGVPQRFYRHFAAWAATQGISVMTYDYRDFGESLARPLRDSRATFADWAVRDQPAAMAALTEVAPDGPLWVLGHSLGGLGLPFHRPPARVSRVITLGAGMGHFSDHPWSYRHKALAFWFLLGPAATALTGYLPGKRLGLGADLPADVYWEWRRWCTRRGFFAGEVGRTVPEPDFTTPYPDLRITSATDDPVVPPIAMQRYAEVLAPAGARLVSIAPADVGLGALGHIDCLGKGYEPFWPRLLGLDG